MPVAPRSSVIDETVVGSYHVSSRAVRRGFLLGFDSETGCDHPHRKTLLLERIEALVSVFAVECLDVSVLDSSFDVIVRNRPDVVGKWTDAEVARRWLTLNRARLALNSAPAAVEIAELAADGVEIAELRGRLSSISWFMAYLKEPLAKRFNLEDGVDGHFWAERFGCVRLTTETALIACSSYMAMNPWRAGEAASFEASRYTAAEMREADERSGEAHRPKSGWLAPVSVSGDGHAGAAAGRRPSDEGYLRMEWSELRRIVEGLVEREAAAELGEEREYLFPETLARLGIEPMEWEAELRVTRRRFDRLLDRAIRMRAEARRARRK